jgi:type VII secretion-associated serine protease mycosin
MKARLLRNFVIVVVLAVAFCVPSEAAPADPIRQQEWFLGVLNIEEAHNVAQGEGATVAVIDTGVDGTHPDLVGNVIPGLVILPGVTGNGWDDSQGHGTAMACLIAGHGHDSQGVLGIAPKARILPIQNIAARDRGRADDAARAIDSAVQRGVNIISISEYTGASDALKAAVQRAQHADAMIVAAAGNTPEDSIISWPAHYDGVIAVASTDRDGNHADVSVTGSQIVIAAPGVDIFSADRGGGYSKETGTSPATAIVAGVVALVRSKYPNLSATEVIHRLTATATDKGPPGRDPEYGYGIVNPVAALTADVPPIGSSSGTPSATEARSAATPRNGGSSALPITVALIAIAGLAAGALAILLIRRRSGSAAGP